MRLFDSVCAPYWSCEYVSYFDEALFNLRILSECSVGAYRYFGMLIGPHTHKICRSLKDSIQEAQDV